MYHCYLCFLQTHAASVSLTCTSAMLRKSCPLSILRCAVLCVSWRFVWVFHRLGVLICKMKPLHVCCMDMWLLRRQLYSYTCIPTTPTLFVEFMCVIVLRLTYSLEEKKKNKPNNFQFPHLSPWAKVQRELQPALATTGCCRATVTCKGSDRSKLL